MKPQEDIGSFIKTKLQSTEKTSKEDTWDRIQSSLEKRKKKKRIAFYFKWGIGITFLLIAGLFILIDSNDITNTEQVVQSQTNNISTSSSTKTKDINIPTDTSMQSVSYKEDSNNQDIQTENGSTSKKGNLDPKEANSTEKTSKSITISTTKKTSTDQEVISSKINVQKKNVTAPTSSKKINNDIIKDSIINRNDVPVTHTTKKVYYYYNSKDGQEMSSTNKAVIDSIIKANEPKQDSLKIN